MTRKCHPERSEGSRLLVNDEILRFAQNDGKAVSFENLNIRLRVSDIAASAELLRILNLSVLRSITTKDKFRI